MTQIFSRPPIQGPMTHAFIIGVGNYPHAKPGQGAKAELRTTKDLPSAADSAKFMCDWLIDNQDKLAAPLASIEMLLSDPAQPVAPLRYVWRNPQVVDGATSVNVQAAGAAWLARLKARPGDVALFYACGHGAGLSTQPVIFLEDLNLSAVNPWAHHNIGSTAASFKQLGDIRAAFFFSDTCREFRPTFTLSDNQDLSRFNAPYDPFDDTGREKVSLMCAATDTMLAYEGSLSDNRLIKLGRFTQMLARGLDGALARWRDQRWVVYPSALFDDIKLLQRGLRPDWRGEPFEPAHAISPNEVFPIVYSPNPTLPVVVRTAPQTTMANYDLRIFNNATFTPPCVDQRDKGDGNDWLAWVPASLVPHYAVAQDGVGQYQAIFVPNMPCFDERITVA
ncbi:hypothetical protein [Sphingomonas sp. KR3-1]|uniref:hypothetical protein n=1 Tax=Sphingomonas sp. KR3-1 TaxID=3156611 RepID=UPI0032B3A5F3